MNFRSIGTNGGILANSGTASMTTGSATVAIDTLNPSVTVNIVDAALSDADNSSLVTFEFSEDVTGFTVDDVDCY